VRKSLLPTFPVLNWQNAMKLSSVLMLIAFCFPAHSQCQPIFTSTSEDVIVNCDESIPGFSNCTAISSCCDGPVTITSITSEVGSVLEDCALSTALGIGPDWSFWLPDLNPNQPNWVFQGAAALKIFGDGTAHLTGTIVNTENSNLLFDINMWFQNGMDWNEWSALGRTYKDDLDIAGLNYLNWTYFELAEGFATFTGQGQLYGSSLQLQHSPENYYYGFQNGVAANNKNENPGFSGWFNYTGIYNEQSIVGHGDVNVDKSCTDLGIDDCAGTQFIQICRAEDACGNTSFTSSSITVADDVIPTVLPYEQTIALLCEESSGIFITAEDNCSTPTITYMDEIIIPGCSGQIIRHYTITDQCGNSTAADQTINLISTPPLIFVDFPNDTFIECTEAGDFVVPDAQWEGGCDNVQLNVTENITPGTCEGEYSIQYTYVLTDDCDNGVSEVFTVYVNDTTPPQLLNVPEDTTINCMDETPNDDVTAVDGCDDNPLVNLVTNITYSDCGYIITKTWNATDNCGNTSFATQVIIVEDLMAPVFTYLPGNLNLNCGETAEMNNALAQDECSSVTITWVDIPLNDCAGSFERQWTATDGCGNAETASTIVTFTDTEAPTIISAPVDVTVSCEAIPDAEDAAIEYADNCSSVTAIYSENIFESTECPGSASIQRLWLLTDECGNRSTITWNITVQDLTAPQLIGIPDDITVECGDISAGTDVFALDNCDADILVSVSATTDQSECGYTFTRTWTATDDCGNTTVGSQIITVNDNEPPVFTYVPNDVIFSCIAGIENVNLDDAQATDECSSVTVTYNDEDLPNNQSGFIRNWLATDGCGNTAVATTMVTVNLSAPPVITCPPAQTVYLNQACNALVPDYVSLVEIDASCYPVENIAITQSPAAASMMSGVGTTVITITATDPNGLSSTCTFNAIRIDTLSPTITCPSNATVIVGVDCFALMPNILTGVSALDNCTASSAINFSQSIPEGSAISASENATVQLIAIDGNGNSSSCSVAIIYVDSMAPTAIVFPQNMSVSCNAIPEVADVGAQFADNCSAVTTTYSESILASGSCAGNYNLLRTWTVTDASGNTSQFTWTIEVTDDIDPVFLNIPTDLTLNCGDTWQENAPNAIDECDPNPTISYSEFIEEGICGYVIVRTWTASDACGNSSSATQTITFNDNQAPEFTVVPENYVFTCSANTQNLEIAAPEVTDNCSSIVLSYEDVAGGSGCAGSFVRTYTATDGCGNSSTVEVEISFNDTEPPVIITFPEDMTLQSCGDLPGIENANISYTDNCGDVTYTVDETNENLGCLNNYILSRNYTFSDNCGNETTRTWTIYVVDEETPQLLGVPESITLNCGDEIPDAPVIAIDNCSTDVNIQLSANTELTECGYTFIRIWTATDECGNSSSATQEIQFTDNEAPIFTFVPADIAVSCGSNYFGESPVATDDCSELTIEEQIISLEDCAGSYIRQFTARDVCGNETTAEQTITLFDNEPPVLSGPENMSVNCDAIPPSDISLVTYSENCSEVTLNYTESGPFGSCSDGGSTIERTWIFTDACGNASTFVWQIVVLDNDMPILNNVPSDIVLGCGDEIPFSNVTATDNCTTDVLVEMTEETISNDCGYSIIRTWTATDNCLNTAEASQTITFTDNTPPVFQSLPQDLNFSCDAFVTAPTLPQATDDCSNQISVQMTEETIDGICTSEYTLLRTYTATDACGNVASHIQTITVTDNEAPVFNDFEIELTVNCEQSNGVFATANDNCNNVAMIYDDELVGGGCGGSLIRTYTATDGCGNSNSAIQFITIVDNIAPVFQSFPADVTVDCGSIPASSTANVQYYDNCSIVVPILSEIQFEGSCPNSYIIERTWLLQDDCGNSTSQSWTITVEDNIAPFILGVPDDVTIDCTGDVPNANVFAVDNCTSIVQINASANTEFNACGYVFTRQWTATDECGNTSTATQVVTVTDLFNPVLSEYPADIQLTCGDNLPDAPVVGVTDNCDENVQVIFTEESIAQGLCDGIMRTWCATDCAGNEECHTQMISFNDPVPPAPFPQNQMAMLVGRPVNGHTTVKLQAGTSTQSRLEVLDVTGKLAKVAFDGWMEHGQLYEIRLATEQFENGVYLIRFINGNDVITEKTIFIF
jgi:large repetitive protein